MTVKERLAKLFGKPREVARALGYDWRASVAGHA